jgi:hypothetical protein
MGLVKSQRFSTTTKKCGSGTTVQYCKERVLQRKNRQLNKTFLWAWSNTIATYGSDGTDELSVSKANSGLLKS